MNYNEIAELLLPDVKHDYEYYQNKYKARNLKEGAQVTRFAPSPTGFLHLGGIYAALISERIAHESEGVFFLRIEDTDKKREVENGVSGIVDFLKMYNIPYDEGMIGEDEEKGAYGPYKQSLREDIYKAFVKKLLSEGKAYPCFCTEEELNEIRKKQEAIKATPGYYGEWAVHRNITLDEIKENLKNGKSFVIRLKSPGNPERKITIKDLIKGKVEMPENDQDIVILKSEGLPTYHFAHAIDDHLMGTTTVIRGEEWLSSAPVHVQLFQVLGFELPRYAHISTIMKMDGNSKRKLSKRKDPEMSLSFYDKEGYPINSVIEYLMNLINSNYEDWRKENRKAPYTDFEVHIDKMGKSGALFDFKKLDDMSRDYIGEMTAEDVLKDYTIWASKYDSEFYDIIKGDEAYLKQIFTIGRYEPKPRKDFAKWSEVKNVIGYFYDSLFNEYIKDGFCFQDKISKDVTREVMEKYMEIYDHNDDKDAWFDKIKQLCDELGFASDNKKYKKNPEAYKGNIGDICMIIRIALADRTNTPDLHDIMHIIGESSVRARFKAALDSLK